MNTDVNPMECIDVKELMRVTGLSRPTITRRIADGTFKPCSGKQGRRLLFRRVTIIRSLAKAEQAA